MELKDTIVMMNSSDFKERFRAEYFQLKNRVEGLSNMLDKYRQNQLEFRPKCSIKLLDGQFNAMKSYLTHLTERAKIEGIDLQEVIPTTQPEVIRQPIKQPETKNEKIEVISQPIKQQTTRDQE